MGRSYYGLIALAILTMMGPTSPQKGCQNGVKALTEVKYPQKRDMRNSVALLSQRGWYRAPDTSSVPTVGREVLGDIAQFDAAFRLATESTPAAVLRGESTYVKFCATCHGTKLDGQGPVWQSKKFMVPPPNLLQAQSVARSDGYIYRYIRFGGAVMPSYGNQVTSQECTDLVHYVRAMQKKGSQ